MQRRNRRQSLDQVSILLLKYKRLRTPNILHLSSDPICPKWNNFIASFGSILWGQIVLHVFFPRVHTIIYKITSSNPMMHRLSIGEVLNFLRKLIKMLVSPSISKLQMEEIKIGIDFKLLIH